MGIFDLWKNPYGMARKPSLEPEYLIGQLKRLQAEFENYRRRTEEEKKRTADQARRDLIASLLVVYDGLAEAEAHPPAGSDAEGVTEGYRSIGRQFMETLEQAGLERMSSRGDAFDPHVHEAVASIEPDGSTLEGTIHEVVQEGYRYKGEVLRHARVVVVGSSLASEESTGEEGVPGDETDAEGQAETDDAWSESQE